jgi:tRNA threonylcarbamoyladenosine biosynthesis protein TsaB
MILLALDTAEKSQGLALLEDGQVLAEKSSPHPSSHADELLLNLNYLLKSAGLSLDRVDAIAVTVGPGSFTGLRIALSTVKALALVRGIPVIPVGTLLALAAPYLDEHPWVAPCLDARMAQVYGAVYSRAEPSGSPRERHPPSAMELIDFNNKILRLPHGGIVVGSGLLAHPSLVLGVKADPQARVGAAWVGRIALQMYKAGEFLAGREVRPAYLRLSTAEERLLEKAGLSAKKAQKTVL